jgi:hypothetical protein
VLFVALTVTLARDVGADDGLEVSLFVIGDAE